ncbi:uncharacterized protein DEA37_0014360 [Paragonimus westermani]|uniref:HD domain-containing protein n=1 Tax=Paragonimus westermani TaxID=34504 RepID=A0A5J4NG21_9TREM|nr:uncharacterized protein DEA37_0014360 [Paragonimus westermani]
MAISTVAKNITKVALCTGAIYYSIVEGVWSTSDQSVGPMSKVKQRLLPQAFQFVNDRTVRTGWTRHDIERPESVSDHMYRMALMATVLPTIDRQDVSIERLIKMTIVHDLAECIVGDITPHCNVSKEEKLDRETKAMDQLCTLIPNDNATEIYELWFEMLLQAFEYEQECGVPKKLEEFFSSTLGCFSTPTVKGWVEDLNSRRQCFSDGPTATPASK